MKVPPSAPNHPRIQFQSTDEDIIARVAALFRVNYCQPDNRNPDRWKQSF